ncbi:hypothetical protein LX64_05157 [Chitinophaga skermanii]|uniref:Uncharacterized protein n=1 Tax=Chitinophaga skermanii TaxID=331697 RepID=A0A327Q6K7_9BACT|nr:hypothetical protein LX64_05157 [Chitinophaga skermanii]
MKLLLLFFSLLAACNTSPRTFSKMKYHNLFGMQIAERVDTCRWKNVCCNNTANIRMPIEYIGSRRDFILINKRYVQHISRTHYESDGRINDRSLEIKVDTICNTSIDWVYVNKMTEVVDAVEACAANFVYI